MARILVPFAHPAFEKSRVHRRLIQGLPDLPRLTVHDLYEAYPTFDIDVRREQELLTGHDLIVLQHPFFWYSTPPLVKQWEDLVLEHGWAYGSKGKALQGKRFLSVITTGGGASAYGRQGLNRFTIRELLAPIEQTAYLCRMEYVPPYVIPGTNFMTVADIEQAASRYRLLMSLLHDDQIAFDALGQHQTLNEVLDQIHTSEVTR